MRQIIRAAHIAVCVALLAAAGPAVATYSCSTGAGADSCDCSGQKDCNDMRHAGVCRSDVICTGSGDMMSCFCDASMVAPGGNASPWRPPLNEAPPPTSAEAPAGNGGDKEPPPNEAPPPTSAQPP